MVRDNLDIFDIARCKGCSSGCAAMVAPPMLMCCCTGVSGSDVSNETNDESLGRSAGYVIIEPDSSKVLLDSLRAFDCLLIRELANEASFDFLGELAGTLVNSDMLSDIIE